MCHRAVHRVPLGTRVTMDLLHKAGHDSLEEDRISVAGSNHEQRELGNCCGRIKEEETNKRKKGHTHTSVYILARSGMAEMTQHKICEKDGSSKAR
jgi:hypothetical protein